MRSDKESRELTGRIFNIQRFSVNDGPGIRTTVFLQGCPLKCPWCHNPESQAVEAVESDEKAAVSAGKSADEGKKSLISGSKMYTVKEVMDIVLRDRTFYETSGGGITLSGGEPLLQGAFAAEILKAAKENGLHTCVETSGCGSKEVLKSVAEYTDLLLYDYKVTGEERHRALIGISESVVLENLALLEELGKKVILRCPLIPGVNVAGEPANVSGDNGAVPEENNAVQEKNDAAQEKKEPHLAAIAALTHRFSNIVEVQIEPYHSFGEHKYREMGREVPNYRVPTDAEAEKWIREIQSAAACGVKRA